MRTTHHRREDKREAVRQWLHGEKRTAQICQEYEISRSTLWRWSQQCSTENLPGISSALAKASDPIVQRLERVESQCERLSQEVQWLKKASKG
jgi:transposase-like protein